MRLVIAFVAAVLAPTLAVVLWYLYGQFDIFDASDPYIWVRTRGFLVLCLVISAAHVTALGVPAFFIRRWRRALRWWTTLLAGFILGTLPAAVFSWPLRYASPGSSASVNGVDTMIDGVPTTAGWLQYLYGVAFFGIFGILAAAAFWLVLRGGPNNSFKGMPLRGTP